jgi:hypothetical protein
MVFSSYITQLNEEGLTDLPPLSFAVMVLEQALVVWHSVLAKDKDPVHRAVSRMTPSESSVVA